MTIQFANILVPADLTINTEIAIKKALEIAEPGATIHLLHVQKNPAHGFAMPFLKYNSSSHFRNNEIEKYLQQWRNAIEESEKKLKSCVWITIGDSIQKAVEKFSKKIYPDLIIIGKHNYHSWSITKEKLTCSKLVKNTGIAVLSVKPGSFHNKMRNLVVPMESQMPEEKLTMITGMSKRYRLKIYLVSFITARVSSPSLHAVSLLDTHRWLSSSIGCPVEYVVLNRANSSKALLDYTRKIDGNLILVFAGIETDSGLMKRDIADVIHPESNIEILTIKKQTSLVN